MKIYLDLRVVYWRLWSCRKRCLIYQELPPYWNMPLLPNEGKHTAPWAPGGDCSKSTHYISPALCLRGRQISPEKYHTLTQSASQLENKGVLSHSQCFWFWNCHRQSEFGSPHMWQQLQLGTIWKEGLSLPQSLILLKQHPSTECCSSRADHNYTPEVWAL